MQHDYICKAFRKISFLSTTRRGGDNLSIHCDNLTFREMNGMYIVMMNLDSHVSLHSESLVSDNVAIYVNF